MLTERLLMGRKASNQTKDNSQTGFIKVRYICENNRLLFEITDNAEKESKPGLIFFSDFEKAFDCIDYYAYVPSSPMGNDRLPWSQHNIWRHHNL